MALVEEDGTGKATANSVVSLAYAETYHEQQDNTAWASAGEEAQTAALIYATGEVLWGIDWPGYPLNIQQALPVPRVDWYDTRLQRFVGESEIPDRLKAAVCERALTHLGSPLNASHNTRDEITRVSVGAIDVRFGSDQEIDTSDWQPIVWTLLQGLTGASSTSYQSPAVRS